MINNFIKKKLYTIKIVYTDGNSFGTKEYDDVIGYVWEDKDKAYDAIKRIEEHDNYFDEKEFALKRNFKTNFKTNEDFEDLGEYSIKLQNDNNEYVKVGCFWRGYFARLEYAKVISLVKN